MTSGQTIGQLCGHLIILAGALLSIAAFVRFFWVGNAPENAVSTVLMFIYAAGLEGIGKLLVWFAGGGNS